MGCNYGLDVHIYWPIWCEIKDACQNYISTNKVDMHKYVYNIVIGPMIGVLRRIVRVGAIKLKGVP